MSKIEWTGKTWNPTTGCDKVSQGCKNCYAEIMHRRLMVLKPEKYSKPFLANVQTHDDELSKPLMRKKPTTYFVNSMSDLFHKDVPFEFIEKVYAVMMEASHHTFQVLTKRPERAAEFFNWLRPRSVEKRLWPKVQFPLPNLWIGPSCEDQKTANERIPYLLEVPAAIHFLSCEPLLGPINLMHLDADGSSHKQYYQINCLTGRQTDMGRPCWDVNKIHWVIAGGESGHQARPMHPDWVRSLRDQCASADVPFFFKQWGEWKPNGQQSADDVDAPGPYLGEPMEYFPDMDKYNRDLEKWTRWHKKNKIDWGGLYATRYGKHRSGNYLDGKQHLEFPKPLKHITVL
jgi:protein gp37